MNVRSHLHPGFLLLPLFFCSCANTTYIPYKGGARTVGKGASLHKINGIDFWTDGLPPRPYKLVGVIHDSRSGLRRDDLQQDLAKVAKKMGADAILEYHDYALQMGGATAAAGAAAGNMIWVGSLVAATGPGMLIAGPAIIALGAAQGGTSRWWAAKYLPAEPKTTIAGPKTPSSAASKQTAVPTTAASQLPPGQPTPTAVAP
ncbi:hypothetical protein [Verrucomicrobium sp. 3C]|uniref:hypothetical protein n=1 Tax=Verrucomicrobium sp. 3C TaxID=1134055 RepID=UPI0003767213|nr:hypothetical protein [Verrucomicrobium sp. 3C]